MSGLQPGGTRALRSTHRGETGAALSLALWLMAVLILLGTAAGMMTTLYAQISGNYKAGIQAFHAAEAGTEEARARLRMNAPAAHRLPDAFPTQAQWRAYIGTDSQAQARGYDSTSALHLRRDSLQGTLNYTVVIRHAVDGAGNVLYWGDENGDGINTRNTTTGQNIYGITGYGVAGGTNKIVEIEAARIPPLTIPGTLYVEAPTTIQGTSSNILGQDDCGSNHQAGIHTPLPAVQGGQNTITENGHPTVTGSPPIRYSGTNLNVQAMINAFKDAANFAYSVSSATHTGTTTPGPGDDWGTPIAGATQQSSSTCNTQNIVHYNTHGTHIRLSGGVEGCGLLLIEGDAEFHGGFSWYGAILITGSIKFTGGGNKNVTGAVLSEGSITHDVVGGNANIVYCSSAITDQTQNRPLRVLRWGEL